MRLTPSRVGWDLRHLKSSPAGLYGARNMEQRLYKLTDEHGKTHGNTQWGPNVTHFGTGKGELCGPGYIHAYEHPLIAVLLNPVHGYFKNPRMWEAIGTVNKRDGQ